VRVIARLNVGGPARHVVHLTKGLASSYPTLLIAGSVAEDEAELPDVTRDPALRLHRLPGLGRAIRPFDDLRAFLQLVRILRRTRPVIVHTHTAKAGTLGRLAAFIAGVPIRIHTYHGHVFRGYFSSLRTRAIILLERLLAHLSTRIIVISNSQLHEITSTFGITKPEKVSVIPLGLELEAFGTVSTERVTEIRAQLGLADQRVITSVGRLVPIKNHRLLLQAAQKVLAERPDTHVLLVGGGSEETALRRLVQQLGIAGRVHFLGFRDDLPELYALSDLVVLSSDNEGTPVALIEALAAGRPVVATDVGGVSDVLEGGRLGMLVPPGNADALAAAIQHSLDRPADASHASSIKMRFSVDRLLADTALLYSRALAAAQPQRWRVTHPGIAR
jgi:glycosyltransferase involved in cell wall biosynthesis